MQRVLCGLVLGAALLAAAPAAAEAQGPLIAVDRYGYVRPVYQPARVVDYYPSATLFRHVNEVGYNFYYGREQYYPCAYRVYPNMLYNTTYAEAAPVFFHARDFPAYYPGR
jgi:hypothetical protein